jgi:LPXTG-motif cell wall-anchored protein
MMKTLTWTKRMGIGTGIALASIFAVPNVVGAASTTCYTACTPPTVSHNNAPPPSPPHTDGPQTAASTTIANGSSTLPFTGADIGELAAVGLGAVLIGGVLTRRRRRTS